MRYDTTTLNSEEPDYRRLQVEAAVDDLPDAARGYARAFAQVDQLIDLVSLKVLGQFVAYGMPKFLAGVSEVERGRGAVRFQAPYPVDLSSIVQIDHLLTPELAIVTSVNINFSEKGISVNRHSADILVGSECLIARPS